MEVNKGGWSWKPLVLPSVWSPAGTPARHVPTLEIKHPGNVVGPERDSRMRKGKVDGPKAHVLVFLRKTAWNWGELCACLSHPKDKNTLVKWNVVLFPPNARVASLC